MNQAMAAICETVLGSISDPWSSVPLASSLPMYLYLVLGRWRLEVIHYTMDQMRILAVLPFWFWYGLLELEKWAGRWKDACGMLCCNRKVMFVHEGKALIGFVGFQCEADVYFSPNTTVM